MNILDVAEQAYNELSRLHDLQGECPGLQNCPTARALTDLMRAIADERSAIGEFKHAHQWRNEPEPVEASLPPHTAEETSLIKFNQPKWFADNLPWLKKWITEAKIESTHDDAQWLTSRYDLQFGRAGITEQVQKEVILDLTDRHTNDMLLALVFGKKECCKVATADGGEIECHFIPGFVEKYGRLPDPTDSVRVSMFLRERLGGPMQMHYAAEDTMRYYYASALNSIELLPSAPDVAAALLTAQSGIGAPPRKLAVRLCASCDAEIPQLSSFNTCTNCRA